MTEYTAEMAHAAVQRGAAWLDRRCPNWFREVDLTILDLEEVDSCILGQTAACLIPEAEFGADYIDVLNRYAPVAEASWARRFGFEVPLGSRNNSLRYEMLTIAWKEYIRERLDSQQ